MALMISKQDTCKHQTVLRVTHCCLPATPWLRDVLTLRPSRWKRNFPPECRLTFAGLLTNSVVLVRERTIPTEQPPLVNEVSANFC
jgi:hypothetical protein